jgi:hypothetical protein
MLLVYGKINLIRLCPEPIKHFSGNECKFILYDLV